MSNQVNHRRPANSRNQWHRELPDASHCAGEGHNGQIGRSKWKKLSRRSERRAAGKRKPKIQKLRKRVYPNRRTTAALQPRYQTSEE